MTFLSQLHTAFLPATMALALALLPGQAGAESPPPAKVASVEGITEYHLANGLRVLLFPDASRPRSPST